MKKLIAMLLAMVMVLGLAACGGNNAPAETTAPEAQAPAETPAATTPLLRPQLPKPRLLPRLRLPPRLRPLPPPAKAVSTT